MRQITISGKIRNIEQLDGNDTFGKRTNFLLDEQVYEDGVRSIVTHGCVRWGNNEKWLTRLSENKLTVIVEALSFRTADAFNEKEVGLTFILQADIVAVV